MGDTAEPAGLKEHPFIKEVITLEAQCKNEDHARVHRSLIRKLDLTLLPILSNIANAKLAGLDQDIGIDQHQYQWCLSIFFFGYVLFELPSNIVLRRWRASKWIAILMFCWGTVAVCMVAIKDFVGLAVCRFLLGAFEAGAFGGILAYGISQIRSSLTGWQNIFLIEGLPTVMLAILCWLFLPDSPETATFLTDDERAYEIYRLAADAGVANDHSWSWAQVGSVFKDWKTYAYMLIYITGTIALQGVTLFLPSIVNGLGHWSMVKSQLMTVPPYMAAFVATILLCFSSDHFVERSFHMVFINLVTVAGFLFLLLIHHDAVGIHYFGAVLVTAGVYANVSIKIAWFNNNFGGLTRRAVASAAIVSFGTIGGAIGGQIYYDPPKYVHGHTIAVCNVGLQTILVVLLRAVFTWENRRRSKLTPEQVEMEVTNYGGVELAGDRHPEFVYTL
ncbi:MFS general substrate transporter [Basidiobolus meristosporus CBS 931.73]|uniref:MFS general substrate transporter n=1 Tax=Basidiobolus meristosporus CBS 931.73 TaxID=1314790 RepID=A0A1Y1YXP4_9FUNG|nr:MFS general substrate transporter [Basidiobolus meristosporus CBS 931.73]|eukprot:ORY02808.1 MFS general substrate transporter [Basidiobolus meristosporus CBS 931.73]